MPLVEVRRDDAQQIRRTELVLRHDIRDFRLLRKVDRAEGEELRRKIGHGQSGENVLDRLLDQYAGGTLPDLLVGIAREDRQDLHALFRRE